MRHRHVQTGLLCLVLAGSSVGLVGCQNDAEKKADSGQLFNQAQVAEADKNTDDAIKKYEAALQKDPKNGEALRALATIYTKQRKFDKAIPLWQRNVTVTSGVADAFNDLGYCQDLAGWNMPTENSYQEALKADPNHKRARINYGLFLARHDRSTEAICQLQLALPPAQAHYNLGMALDEVHKVREARAEYAKALKLQPNFREAQERLDANGTNSMSARTE